VGGGREKVVSGLKGKKKSGCLYLCLFRGGNPGEEKNGEKKKGLLTERFQIRAATRNYRPRREEKKKHCRGGKKKRRGGKSSIRRAPSAYIVRNLKSFPSRSRREGGED